jgi:hypothetical protein
VGEISSLYIYSIKIIRKLKTMANSKNNPETNTNDKFAGWLPTEVIGRSINELRVKWWETKDKMDMAPKGNFSEYLMVQLSLDADAVGRLIELANEDELGKQRAMKIILG